MALDKNKIPIYHNYMKLTSFIYSFPDEYDIQTPSFTFNALEGNCLVIMQEKSAQVTTTAAPISGRNIDSTAGDGSTGKSLTSETTPSATQFFKRSYKSSHPPRL